ncbi:NADH-quinone oxidoreductase subunit D [Serinibacter arcticus]|uniref:NADH-quinone oxidoreductase subunit D n=1 Tax=Serinibacter arcticus TaxID=1655435 RepID=A0A4Z1E551_9MICO|nr:NADH-quinone oxidoreductase subunit D [Serinibacter arcticus]TGO06420.1 NADH-ubiquinone oxidoreductase chain D [Serinibacter arcticus]
MSTTGFDSDVDSEADGTEGVRTFTANGGDWAAIAEEAARLGEERIVVNMGPQHPSTHGVLRLILEIDGETVREARVGIGYLHTGIEKNMEFRTWTQGVTFCTRMDYVAPFFQEVGYCLAVEKLLGIEAPERATLVRVLLMELQRAASHLVAIATGGNELGATTIMIEGFQAREEILKIFELVSGLRMNHAYIRPGGLAQDVPPGTTQAIRDMLPRFRKHVKHLHMLMDSNPIFAGRAKGVGYLPLSTALSLGVTGPILRSAGLPFDLRKDDPYCGYETYDFDVPTSTDADAFARVMLRFDEIDESLKIAMQVVERLEKQDRDGQSHPVMVDDPAIAWPAQLAIGPDGQGNSAAHIRKIMGQSMESLIHHFKLVTEGFRVPAGQVYQQIEHAKGVLGIHLVSDGATRPYRAHFRDPSFTNLQSLAAMCEGGQIADVVVAVASIDPVLGGVDR